MFTFLLGWMLGRASVPAACWRSLFLLLDPLFYTQAMMAQLDMPAMLFTVLALVLFLDDARRSIRRLHRARSLEGNRRAAAADLHRGLVL